MIYHSCGSIFDAIPELIKLGVDAIQVLANDMAPGELKRHHGNQVSFRKSHSSKETST